MAAKPGRRWIYAVLLAVVFPALAVHVSCVAVIGTGSWGSGMEEKAPRWNPIEPGSPAAAYVREFANRQPADTAGAAPDSASPPTPQFGDPVRGKPFWTDFIASENLGVVATHEGESWVEGQHIYLWSGREQASGQSPQEQAGQATGAEPQQGNESAPRGDQAPGQGIRELDMPSEMIVERPTLMKRGGKTLLVAGRWRPWAISPLEKLSRYLNSYADPSLRPEHSLYVHPLPSGPLEYWGPGHTLEPSPDRRFAILLRSGSLGAGYYSVHLWDFERDLLSTIVSLREAEQGSGRSFDYEWSSDSRAVHITGETGGFARRGGERRSLDLLYLVGEEGLYDLEVVRESRNGAGLSSSPPQSR
jgi:hypothetical protein